MAAMPRSILFCCDHNAVRSPMAEALMKQQFGHRPYVQSAGLINDLDVDGFAIAVCEELGIALHRHRARSFGQLEASGEALAGFDLVIALSEQTAEAARRQDKAPVEFWPISDPTRGGGTRAMRLERYRETRDQIRARLAERWPSTRPAP